MARLLAASLHSPHGEVEATLAALLRGHGGPGRLPGALLERLLGLARDLAPHGAPDLVLLASTKGDCPAYAEALVSGDDDHGSPRWLAAELAQRLGVPTLALGAACASGPVAVAEAARRLHAGQVRRVLVLGGDRLAPFVEDGFASLRAIDPAGCRPFDPSRAGLCLGEADAALLLDAGPGGIQVQGWGGSLDGCHLTAPDPEGRGLEQAIRRACARAGIERPAWICGHGTGTRANDSAELAAYGHLGWDLPVVGWKGLLGHSLGANGLVELVLAARILEYDSALPGTVGLHTRADRRVLRPGPHPRPPGPMLSTNAGFGGLNAAVILGSEPPRPLAPRAVTMLATSRVEPVAGELPRRSAREVLGRPDASWGRLDRSCRLLVELLLGLGPLPADSALVLLSDSGCRLTDRAYEWARRAGEAEPQRFVYTLPSIPIGEASIRCGIHGPGLALQHATDADGRETARLLIADGAAAAVVARIEELGEPCAWAELWRASDVVKSLDRSSGEVEQ